MPELVTTLLKNKVSALKKFPSIRFKAEWHCPEDRQYNQAKNRN